MAFGALVFGPRHGRTFRKSNPSDHAISRQIRPRTIELSVNLNMRQMETELGDFERFMTERQEVAKAYVNGNAEPLSHIATRASPATFFSPGGGAERGAKQVFTVQEHDAEAFEPGGDSTFEILQMGASDGLAYWVGFQRAKANMCGKDDPVPFDLRVTEIFRREDGCWKLVHRHADMQVEKQEKPG